MNLVAENLSIERGGRTIIDGLSFAVAAGEALVLTGANGAGKTSLLRAVAGFLPPVAGAVRLEGAGEDAEIGEHCHYVGHRDGVKASLSVAENARFWSSYLGGGDPAGPALDEVGLAALASVPAAYLSAGQRRRLGLARLLLAPRTIWLLDEPTVSLDASGVVMLARLLTRHLAGGGLALVATHVPLGVDGGRELRLASSSPPATGEEENP